MIVEVCDVGDYYMNFKYILSFEHKNRTASSIEPF